MIDNGYIEGKELDDFFRHMMKKLGPQVRDIYPEKSIQTGDEGT